MMPEIKDSLLRARWWFFHLNRRQVFHWVYKATRPGSDPYISGDGFRRLARHVYDETNQSMKPEAVREGDAIFVSTEYAHRFFEEIEPRITVSYKLITHNSDVPVDDGLAALCSEKVQAWFAQNNTHAHEKVIPIPIGLENLHHYHVGVPQEFNSARKRVHIKKPRILAGFTVATNPDERRLVHELAAKANCVDQLPERLSQPEYLRRLATYRFLLSPPGNGLDTHRTWEAMYVGVVPIVKDSVAMRAFESQGLPLWILPRWEDILDLEEEELQYQYRQMLPRFESPALWLPYWRRLIAATSPAAVRPMDGRTIPPARAETRRSGL